MAFFFFQFGVRTEGIQEALLKIPEVPENTERITKMKQVMKAVSSRDHSNVNITPFFLNYCEIKAHLLHRN